MHTLLVKGLAVVRHVLVSVHQRPFQAFQLERLQFVTAGALDRLQVGRGGNALDHGATSIN